MIKPKRWADLARSLDGDSRPASRTIADLIAKARGAEWNLLTRVMRVDKDARDADARNVFRGVRDEMQ
jgi:hypothetical protein